MSAPSTSGLMPPASTIFGFCTVTKSLQPLSESTAARQIPPRPSLDILIAVSPPQRAGLESEIESHAEPARRRQREEIGTTSECVHFVLHVRVEPGVRAPQSNIPPRQRQRSRMRAHRLPCYPVRELKAERDLVQANEVRTLEVRAEHCACTHRCPARGHVRTESAEPLLRCQHFVPPHRVLG